jgi:glycerol-3-phosphate dehydrogenase (NAD(P)+)
VGERLGKGQTIQDIMGSMQMVAEGVDNAKLLRDLAAEYHIEMPISEVVYRMCYENLTAEDAVMMLMGRAAKPE